MAGETVHLIPQGGITHVFDINTGLRLNNDVAAKSVEAKAPAAKKAPAKKTAVAKPAVKKAAPKKPAK